MASVIRFGTSGWRGIIARDFTFANVHIAAQAIAKYLNQELKRKKSPIFGKKPVVLLGHDTRFAGPAFAKDVAAILAENGLQPILCDRDAPTPVLAHSIRARKAIAGINITASHNPPEYQGLKLSLSNGAGAGKDVTAKIEKTSDALFAKGWTFKPKKAPAPVKTFDPRPDYIKQLKKLVKFNAIKKAKLKIGVELCHGTGRGYLDTLLRENGVQVTTFHADLNPGFGGRGPEPNEEGMKDVRDLVLKKKAQFGLGLDGDADRFGIVDTDGTWLTPNQILALVLYHLKKNRGWTGSAVRTVPTSHQIDAVGEMLGVKVHETPVGFKYIGAIMESEPVIVGGEESGGLSVKGHVPEKDGVLACLLMAELYAMEKRPFGKILKEIEAASGEFHTDRINIHISADSKEAILKKLEAGVPKIGSFKVIDSSQKDGYKFSLPSNEWVAFRASGTEPVFRCYIEARSAANLKKLSAASRKLLTL